MTRADLEKAIALALRHARTNQEAAVIALQTIEEAGFDIVKRDDIQEVSRRAQQGLKL